MRQPLFVLRDSVCAGTEPIAAEGACHRGSTDTGGGGLSRGGDFRDEFGAVGAGSGGKLSAPSCQLSVVSRWSSEVGRWRATTFQLRAFQPAGGVETRTTNDQRPTTGISH